MRLVCCMLCSRLCMASALAIICMCMCACLACCAGAFARVAMAHLSSMARTGSPRRVAVRDGVRKARCPEMAQDGPKMVPRWLQGAHKMVLSCKRSAKFAKLAMPSSVRSPRGPKVAPRRPKTSRDGPEMTQDGPRMPQDGPKMTPRWTQEATSWAEETTKWCSRVSEVRILPNELCRRRSALRESPK